jgi:WD40 repeat protein
VAVALGNSTHLYDLGSGKEVRQFDGHTASVLGVAFAPDGKTLLSGGNDSAVCWWDVETGRQLHVFRGQRDGARAVAFSPDGRRVLTAGGVARNGNEAVPGRDFTIRIWPLPAR